MHEWLARRNGQDGRLPAYYWDVAPGATRSAQLTEHTRPLTTAALNNLAAGKAAAAARGRAKLHQALGKARSLGATVAAFGSATTADFAARDEEVRQAKRAERLDRRSPQSGGLATKEAQWDVQLREAYNDLLRENGLAPGALRLQRYLAVPHASAPRYLRADKDRDIHPWNNDGAQVAARVPLTRIELTGRHNAFNNIPTTHSMRPSHLLSSTAYGQGYMKTDAIMQHPGNGYTLHLNS